MSSSTPASTCSTGASPPGDGDRLALTGVGRRRHLRQLHDRVRRVAAGLRALGLQPEQRVLMFMADSPRVRRRLPRRDADGRGAGPGSTMLHADGLAELVADSRARLVVVTPTSSRALAERGGRRRAASHTARTTRDRAAATTRVYPTTADVAAFWLYTSGTTGLPKGAMHRHGSIRVVCETYGTQVLGIRPDDRCLSAAKAFFAYGLGNSVLFPLAVGAAAVLEPAPSRPDADRRAGAEVRRDAVLRRADVLRQHAARRPAAPTRWAASGSRVERRRGAARRALRAVDHALRRRHPRRHRHDRDAAHLPVQPGRRGPARHHRRRRPRLRPADPSTRTGARRSRPARPARCSSAAPRRRPATGRATTPRGRCSRASGCAPATPTSRTPTATTPASAAPATCSRPAASGSSPAEVEARLLAHDAVAQAVVVAAHRRRRAGEAGRLRRAARRRQPSTEDELIAFCRAGLPSFKRPRRVVFVDAYPTTATGKIRRVELRALAARRR